MSVVKATTTTINLPTRVVRNVILVVSILVKVFIEGDVTVCVMRRVVIRDRSSRDTKCSHHYVEIDRNKYQILE